MGNVKTPPIIIFDYETGGFDCRVNAVTEFAGIAIDGETFEEIARYEALLMPYGTDLLYDPKALEVTGITMQMLQQGIDFKTFTKEYLTFLKKANIFSQEKYRPILAGHNVGFDIGFKQQHFFLMGKKIEDYLNCYTDFHGYSQPKHFDTQVIAMSKWGNDESMVKHRLIDCAHKVGIEIINAHRAMNDVVATKDLLINFLKSLRNEGYTGTIDSIVNEVRFRDTFKF